MAEFILKGGATLTDAQIEELARKAEQGDYPGNPGAWIIRPQGRPAQFAEDLVTVTLRVPASMRDTICAKRDTIGRFGGLSAARAAGRVRLWPARSPGAGTGCGSFPPRGPSGPMRRASRQGREA